MLPNEILSLIIQKVDADTLINCRLVSTYFCNISSNPQLWCKLLCSTEKTFCFSKKQCDNYYNGVSTIDCYYSRFNLEELESLDVNFETRHLLWTKLQEEPNIHEIYIQSNNDQLQFLITQIIERMRHAPNHKLLYNLMKSSPMGFYKGFIACLLWKEQCMNTTDDFVRYYNIYSFSPFCIKCMEKWNIKSNHSMTSKILTLSHDNRTLQRFVAGKSQTFKYIIGISLLILVAICIW